MYIMILSNYNCCHNDLFSILQSLADNDRLLTDVTAEGNDDEFEKYASYLLDAVEVVSTIHSKSKEEGRGEFRLLRKTDTAEYHERRLGSGYSIRTSVLLA